MTMQIKYCARMVERMGLTPNHNSGVCHLADLEVPSESFGMNVEYETELLHTVATTVAAIDMLQHSRWVATWPWAYRHPSQACAG